MISMISKFPFDLFTDIHERLHFFIYIIFDTFQTIHEISMYVNILNLENARDMRSIWQTAV